MRIQVRDREEVVKVVERDARLVAAEHGVNAPGPGASGDEIMTSVPLPADIVIVTGGSLRGVVAVQGRHRRGAGWCYTEHRVVVLDQAADGRLGAVLAASPWRPGRWEGDSGDVAEEGRHPSSLLN